MDALFLCLYVSVIALLLVLFREVNRLERQMTDLLLDYSGEEMTDLHSLDANELSPQEDVMHEEFINERRASFEQRINSMKEELSGQPIPKQPTTVAEILHPAIENLPHDTIPDYDINPPSVEYAD